VFCHEIHAGGSLVLPVVARSAEIRDLKPRLSFRDQEMELVEFPMLSAPNRNLKGIFPPIQQLAGVSTPNQLAYFNRRPQQSATGLKINPYKVTTKQQLSPVIYGCNGCAIRKSPMISSIYKISRRRKAANHATRKGRRVTPPGMICFPPSAVKQADDFPTAVVAWSPNLESKRTRRRTHGWWLARVLNVERFAH
jgi:hypothetical protein